MSDHSDIINQFSTIDSPNSLMTNILQNISNESLNIHKIINSIPNEEIKSSDLIDYILEDIDENTLKPNDLIIETDSNSTETTVEDFPNNSSKVLLELSKSTTNRLVQYLPKQYSKFLPPLPDFFNQIYKISKNPEQEISRITEEKINEILSSISNDYLKISVDNFNISGEGKTEKIKFNLNSTITPPKPFVIVKMRILGPSKELVKITFQIKGTLNISNIAITKNQSEFILSPGELLFTLDFWLKKLSIVGKENFFSEDEEDGIKKLASCKYEKKFKKITFS